jgi:hypothetical protein
MDWLTDDDVDGRTTRDPDLFPAIDADGCATTDPDAFTTTEAGFSSLDPASDPVGFLTAATGAMTNLPANLWRTGNDGFAAIAEGIDALAVQLECARVFSRARPGRGVPRGHRPVHLTIGRGPAHHQQLPP